MTAAASAPERVIYSACYRLPGATDEEFRAVLEMVELWLAHLRGPGAFAGRVLLLTNQRTLPLPGVELVPIGDDATDRKALFRQRPLTWDRLPVRAGESWMQLDADSLALRPVEPLFARPGDRSLRCSPSGLTVLRNADPVLGRVGRLWHGRVRGWRERPGVSACLTSCMGEHWARLMAPWAEAVRRYQRRPTGKPVGDQGLLNLLYLTGRIEVSVLPPGLIHHVRGEEDLFGAEANAAHVLHFPNPWRAEQMRRRSVV